MALLNEYFKPRVALLREKCAENLKFPPGFEPGTLEYEVVTLAKEALIKLAILASFRFRNEKYILKLWSL